MESKLNEFLGKIKRISTKNEFKKETERFLCLWKAKNMFMDIDLFGFSLEYRHV